MIYGAKEQLSPEDDTTPPLDIQGTKLVQGIVGALLYYARAMDKKLLLCFSAIISQQAAINKILDYCATYPSDGIIYCSSYMVFCAYSDTGFHNESKGRNRSGAHIFLSENDAMPDETDLC